MELHYILNDQAFRCKVKRFAVTELQATGDIVLAQEVGGWLIDQSAGTYSLEMYCPSPVHGRAACHHSSSTGWTSVKGLGWTCGPKNALASPKEKALYFGLYDQRAAERELVVSNLLSRSLNCTRVRGYTSIPPEEITGTLGLSPDSLEITPVLLYTTVKHPMRVADLAYLDDVTKREVIRDAAEALECEPKNFVLEFIKSLSKTVFKLHDLGGCNDTLDAGNVTLAAELTDFEWITVPDVPLPWGDGSENLERRQLKELIYILEVGVALAGLLQRHDVTPKLLSQTIVEQAPSSYHRNRARNLLGV